MKVLTSEELRDAKAHLEIVKLIHKEVGQRIKFSKTSEFEAGTIAEQMVYLATTKGIITALQQEVAKIAATLEVDLDKPLSEQLAMITDMLDGNRRMAKK